MGKATTLDLGAWFILRCAATDTIKLAEALARFGVWTPIERRVGRTPRKRTAFDRQLPLIPTYLFAPVERLDDILALSFKAVTDQPKFSVFLHRGGVPLIATGDLDPLRHEEIRLTGIFNRLKQRGKKGPTLSVGDAVNLTEGPFMGLPGIVEGQRGQYTMVSFPGFPKPIRVSSVLLLDEQIEAKAA